MRLSDSDRYGTFRGPVPPLAVRVGTAIAPEVGRWLTAVVDDNEAKGQVNVAIETEVADVDHDGTTDVIRETTTTVVDVDGDGVPDIVQQTSTVAMDVDGDGVPDIIERTTVTGIDLNRDGTIDEDEIEVEIELAVRKDLLDEDDAES